MLVIFLTALAHNGTSCSSSCEQMQEPQRGSKHPTGRHIQIAKGSNLCLFSIFSQQVRENSEAKLLTENVFFECRQILAIIYYMKKQSLNLKNPKQMHLIHTFAISEGRLSKEQILTQGNKELFYRMKNNGYIKETVKGSGIYKATSKLKTLTEKTTGISYGNGCSSKHSAKIGKAVSYLPDTVISEGRFTSGQMLKQEMQSLKQTPQYQKSLAHLQRNILREERTTQTNFQNYISKCSRAEHYQAEIDHRADKAMYQMKREVAFSETPVFIPDFKVSVSRTEGECILHNMTEQMQSLPERSKEHFFLEQSIEKIQQMLQTEQISYDLYFEIVTNNYGKPELERHHNYEIILNREVLYIY